MKAFYYPGCSQKATARCYEEALLQVAPKLGIELTEIDDWNCCGASLVPAVNKVLALSLAARNLALAERQGAELVITPCPSCNLNLNKAHQVLTENGPHAAEVREALAAGGVAYNGGVKTLHLIEVLVQGAGLESIRAAITKPLAGVKVAPYYGCQLVRPYAPSDDPGNPQNMERVITAVGAEVAAFPLKTACCGGALVATRPEVGDKLCGDVLASIRAAGATAIVTPCSLCQVTLEMAQRKHRKEAAVLPTLNLGQLVGLALGVDPDALGTNRLLAPRACVRALAEARPQAALPA
jgi:heterodisulfide reductase subunit B2